MLAFVLALALNWYALNPAPGPVQRIKRDEGQPDGKRREVKLPSVSDCDAAWNGVNATESISTSHTLTVKEVDELEWPEVIDLT